MTTDLAPFAGTVGGGFFIGVITGYAIKKVIKLTIVIVGLAVLAQVAPLDLGPSALVMEALAQVARLILTTIQVLAAVVLTVKLFGVFLELLPPALAPIHQ